MDKPQLQAESSDETRADESVAELDGLKRGTLSMNRALGLAVVVFSPVLTAATVGTFVGGVAGSSGWLSALAGTVVMACIGVAIVPFARRFVVSGALYSYIGHVFGRWAKFVSGASLAVGYAGGMVVMLGVLGLYAGSMFSSVFGIAGANTLGGQAIIYAVTAASGGYLAYRSLDGSARLTIWMLLVSAPVVAVILVANVFTQGFDFGSQFTFSDFSVSGFTMGIVLSATFLVAFETSAATALETEDPVRTVPRVIILVPVIVGGIAVLSTLLTVPALGSIGDQVAAGQSPIAAMAHNAHLGVLADIADIALVVTSYAIVVGFMNYAPRVWATMANDGLLPNAVGRISPKRQTPVVAIVVIGVLATVFPIILAVLTGAAPFDVYLYLATFYPYPWVIPYILICVGAVVMLWRVRELTVGKALASLVGAVGIAWVYLNSVINPTGTALDYMTWAAPIAIGVTMLIMGATRLWSRRSREAVEAR